MAQGSGNRNDMPVKLGLDLPKKTNFVTPGLSSTIGSVEPTDTFGDSGDIFNHMYWRDLFALLATTKAGMSFLLGLSQKFLLRGQSEKRTNRAKCVKYSFNSDALTTDEKTKNTFWSTNQFIDIYVNFPTESSRVSSNDLTPERLKCCLRPYVVSRMMSSQRLPATSMAIGYGRLVLDLHKIISAFSTLTQFFTTVAGKNDEERESIIPDLSRMEITAWHVVANKVTTNDISKYVTVVAAYAGSVSSKEIYMFDENLITGVVFWSGLHALMTDISNKNKAMHVTADLRARYEMSSFYDDFKRKMAARKMSIANSKEYILFLQSFMELIPIYIFNSTQIKTEEEVQVIDSVMQKINSLKMNTEGLYKRHLQKVSDVTTHSTAEAVERSILHNVMQLDNEPE